MMEGTASSRPEIRTFFAEFGVRMAGVVLDLHVVIVLVISVIDVLPDAVNAFPAAKGTIAFATIILYFALFWSSPMRAAPVQFLMGMRVIDKAGDTLKFRQAAIRSVSLVALVFATFTIFKVQSSPFFAIITLLSLGLLFLAAMTPNRQAAHDFLAHSIVVNRTALNSPQRRAQLQEHVADNDPTSYRQRRPLIIRMIRDAFLLAAPLVALSIVIPIQTDKSFVARTHYAVREVAELKAAIEKFYFAENRWPTRESELGAATRVDYPDGGFYELEEDGVIRIRFTVKPQLMKGSIVVTPVLEDDRLTWECRVDGDIVQNYLPRYCRG